MAYIGVPELEYQYARIMHHSKEGILVKIVGRILRRTRCGRKTLVPTRRSDSSVYIYQVTECAAINSINTMRDPGS